MENKILKNSNKDLTISVKHIAEHNGDVPSKDFINFLKTDYELADFLLKFYGKVKFGIFYDDLKNPHLSKCIIFEK